MAIVLENLEFGYDGKPVISKADVTFAEGNVHLILGRTGSGKTTLALLMAGLLKPTGGRILVDGVQPTDLKFDRRWLQLAFQFPEAQIFESTVEREIAFGLKNFGVGISDRLRWACGCVGIGEDLLKRDPVTLSFGERRRVALASVIALQPRYLVLDEPLAGLDWIGRHQLVNTIDRLSREGMTILILTHETDMIGEIGDTVTTLENGQLSRCLKIRDFLAQEPHDSWLVPDHISLLRRIASAGIEADHSAVRIDEVAKAIVSAVRSD